MVRERRSKKSLSVHTRAPIHWPHVILATICTVILTIGFFFAVKLHFQAVDYTLKNEIQLAENARAWSKIVLVGIIGAAAALPICTVLISILLNALRARNQNPDLGKASLFILALISKPENREAALGDATERFNNDSQRFGGIRAYLLFWRDVLVSIAPFLIEKFKKLLKWVFYGFIVERFFQK